MELVHVMMDTISLQGLAYLALTHSAKDAKYKAVHWSVFNVHLDFILLLHHVLHVQQFILHA